MRALILGGGGFLGSSTARALREAGHSVAIFDRQPPDAHEEEIPYFEGDVRNGGDLEQAFLAAAPDAVVHMASIVDPRVLRDDPIRAFEINTASVVAALQSSMRHQVQRFVYLSSISAIAPGAPKPIAVDAPFVNGREGSPLAFYGASKAASECWVMGFKEAFDLDVRIVRPSAVYGPGMRYGMGIKDLVEGVSRGEDVSIRTGTRVTRDYTHVDDVASLVERCVALPLRSDDTRVFHAATGKPPVDLFQVKQALEALVPGARIELEDALSPYDERENAFRGALDIRDAADLLGWRPRYPLEDGLAHYLEHLARARRPR